MRVYDRLLEQLDPCVLLCYDLHHTALSAMLIQMGLQLTWLYVSCVGEVLSVSSLSLKGLYLYDLH